MTYSNPRTAATFDNWPYGRNTTDAEFIIETKGNKQRACRRTKNPKNGKWNAWKKATYSDKVRIVDGDDGKTYIAHLGYFVHIMQWNLQFTHESIHPGDERFPEMLKLFS